jgi:nucleoside-diphosphate-sugar epimerase
LRVLVIGGTGFVGSRVVARLSGLGHDMTVAHRGLTEPELPAAVRHVHHPALDTGSPDFVVGALDELRRLAPEIVLHMNQVNDVDAGALVGAFSGVARRVLTISSMDVYRAYGRFHGTEPGPPEPVPLTEDAPLREALHTDRLFDPESRAENILAEQGIASDPGLPSTILRWPFVYGPGDQQHRLYQYVRRMLAGRRVIMLEEGVAGWRVSRGFTENVAAAVVLAVTSDRAAGRVYNVGEPDALSEAEWVREVGRAAGWEGEVVTVPREVAPPHLVPAHNTAQDLVGDTSRIRAELGYAEEVPRLDALRRTIAWERANLPAKPSEEDMQARYAVEDAALAQLR